ncbi:MAG: DUF4214 domain-containing protein [Pseudomonadota bacterium]
MNPTRISYLYAFGDSLVDDGKTYGTFPLAPMFGSPPFPVSPPYDDGRYSNGPMWTEYLADSLGAPSEADRNFAFGGATSGVIDDAEDPLQTLASFGGQIDLFEAAFGGFSGRDLVTVTFGGNDVPLAARAAFEAGAEPADGLALVTGNIADGLERLTTLGAERILVTNLPDLALVPFVNANPEAVEAEFGVTPADLTGLTLAFNAALAREVEDVEVRTGAEIILFDTFAFFADIVAEPARFGIENVEEEVLATGSTSLAPVFNPAIDGRDPAVADATLFFDQDFHPTTAVHALLAQTVREQLAEEGAVDPGPGLFRGEVAQLVDRLYRLALDRDADDGGLAFWTDAVLSGFSVVALAEAFLTAPERGHEREIDDAFIAGLYRAGFGREADAAGLAFWTDALESAAFDRTDALLAFAESDEWQSANDAEADLLLA